MSPRQVIIVTDGDPTARGVIEKVARNIGGRCISLSAGNPTAMPGEDIAAAIKRTPHGPVLVMVDDGGQRGAGPGERALAAMARDPDIEIIGAIAVASHTGGVEGVAVGTSVDHSGCMVPGAVSKDGTPSFARRITGDTVDILNRLDVPVIVGVGDLGKMAGADSAAAGARITTRAVQEILELAAGRVGEDRA